MANEDQGPIVTRVIPPPPPMTAEKAQKEATDKFIFEAGEAVEFIAKLLRQFALERNLSQEQAAFALTLLYLNARADYPKELKGPEGFDSVAKLAMDYFERQTVAPAPTAKK